MVRNVLKGCWSIKPRAVMGSRMPIIFYYKSSLRRGTGLWIGHVARPKLSTGAVVGARHVASEGMLSEVVRHGMCGVECARC